jgi:competence ComEA-like helix-hairpin-helix protein
MDGSPTLRAASLVVSTLALVALASTHANVPGSAQLQRSLPVASVVVSALRDGQSFDLNRASAEDFRLLPGVGPKLAARIVAERERRGGFRRAEDLREVRGIGPITFARLRRFVRVVPDAQRSKNSIPDSVIVK